jgi:hypothetical protein
VREKPFTIVVPLQSNQEAKEFGCEVRRHGR